MFLERGVPGLLLCIEICNKAMCCKPFIRDYVLDAHGYMAFIGLVYFVNRYI